MTDRFWENLSLEEFDQQQWESLCDRCARCCLHKIIKPESDELLYTKVACRQLNTDDCSCNNYQNRVPGCITLTPQWVRQHLNWMPSTCAYRLVAENRPLYSWHPLISGDPRSVRKAGISVQGRVVKETSVTDFDEHIIRWVA